MKVVTANAKFEKVNTHLIQFQLYIFICPQIYSKIFTLQYINFNQQLKPKLYT